MTDWRPTCGPEIAARRADLLGRLRQHFDNERVLEIDTPALSRSAVSDVQIESLQVTSVLTDQPLYLNTSPEFCMKRMLAAGYPDIYSICRVFRDGESGSRHQPEFTLLEWYRLGFDLNAIVDDALVLVAAALGRPSLAETAEILDYREAFAAFANVDPLSASVAELADAAHGDASLRNTLGDERDDWLDLLLTTRVATAFKGDRLTVLRHYPASQAALAQLCPNNSLVAERFEIFMGALELANGYVELTDAEEQSRRIAADQTARQHRGQQQRASDDTLISALSAGLPACAGVAVGIERLQMVHENTDDIRSVISFPFEHIDD
jgi:lysyl-tRNA synthetase class 2